MKISYIVSRTVRQPHKRKVIETLEGEIEVAEGKWNDAAWHSLVRYAIHSVNPGWMVVSYCRAGSLVPMRRQILGRLASMNSGRG